jgi:acetyl-CoA carboxylase biotin carboxyl carrier protein
MALSDEDVREILRIIDESELDELRIETEGFSLHVRRGGGAEAMPSPAAPSMPAAPSRPAEASPSTAEAPAPASSATPPPGDDHDGKVTIESPMLGTFYRAEGPNQDPFVEIGSRVEPDTTVCIIEVMKMMNSVPAGVAGTIVEICHENAKLVEFGEPIFRIEPAG